MKRIEELNDEERKAANDAQNKLLEEHTSRPPTYKLMVNAREAELLNLAFALAVATVRGDVRVMLGLSNRLSTVHRPEEAGALGDKLSVLHEEATPELKEQAEDTRQKVYVANGIDPQSFDPANADGSYDPIGDPFSTIPEDTPFS